MPISIAVLTFVIGIGLVLGGLSTAIGSDIASGAMILGVGLMILNAEGYVYVKSRLILLTGSIGAVIFLVGYFTIMGGF